MGQEVSIEIHIQTLVNTVNQSRNSAGTSALCPLLHAYSSPTLVSVVHNRTDSEQKNRCQIHSPAYNTIV